MRKIFIIISLILISTYSFSQENKKWVPSVKVGAGTWLDISSLIHTEIGGQMEYKSSDIFSLIGNVDFGVNFGTNSTTTEFNQLSLSAGPRFYIQNKIFVGAAFGYLQSFYNTYTNYSSGYFLLHSYAGYNTRKFQYSVDFKVNTSAGEVQSYILLSAAFKFGK